MLFESHGQKKELDKCIEWQWGQSDLSLANFKNTLKFKIRSFDHFFLS